MRDFFTFFLIFSISLHLRNMASSRSYDHGLTRDDSSSSSSNNKKLFDEKGVSTNGNIFIFTKLEEGR